MASTAKGTKLVRKTGRRSAPASMTSAQFERLTVIQQVRRALGRGARLAGVTGLAIGGFIPIATYTLVHRECASHPSLWVLVAGGLLYSALTVFAWARAAFGSTYKAVGFCVLLEGILTFGHLPALGLSALALLVFINAVSAACSLQVRRTPNSVDYS